MIDQLLAFAAGFAYEGLAVWWTISVTRGSPVRAGLASMLQATWLVLGVNEVRDPVCAATFVLGYGLGSMLAVAVAARRST